jgi:hypothetical protein
MCIRPQTIYVERGPTYVKQEVPCTKCWACVKNAQNDLIGRAMAEAPYSQWMHVLTLTYDDRRLRDPSQTRLVHKEDFQNFLKRLRRKHPCRFLVAGEFGKRKGRTHFHAIIFGQTRDEPQATHYEEKRYYPKWEWGFGYSERHTDLSYRTARYVAKYLTKTKENKRDDGTYNFEWVQYSKQPLMGAPLFVELAERYADERLPPYTLNYVPPGYRGNSRFSMYGRAQFVFFDALLAKWPEYHTVPKNDWVENAYKRYLRFCAQRAFDRLTPEQQTEALSVYDPRQPWRRPLTQHERMRIQYANFDRRLAWQNEPEDVKRRSRRMVESALKSCLHRPNGQECDPSVRLTKSHA